jgi:hypothetical protein
MKHSLTHVHSLYSLMEIWSQVMETGATPPVGEFRFTVKDDVGDLPLTDDFHCNQTYTQSCTAYPRRFSFNGETAPPTSSAP